MAELHDGVALTELGVITRWSLAVRQLEVERAELIAELRADLSWLEDSRPRSTRPVSSARAPQPAPRSLRSNDMTQEIAPQVAGDEPEVQAAPAPAKAATPLRRLPAKTATVKESPAAKTVPPKTLPAKTLPAKTPSAKTAKAPARKTVPRSRRPSSGE